MTWGLNENVLRESQRVLQDRPFIWLYGITVPENGGQEIRLARSNVDIYFGFDNDGEPMKWQAAAISNGDFTVDSESSLPSFEITVADPRHTIGAKIEEWDYLTRPPAPVRVLVVHQDFLHDLNHALRFRFRVSSLSMNHEAVTARLSTYNFFAIQFPQDRVARQTCRFVYGGARCGFDVDNWDPGLANLGSCGQTLSDCKARGAYEASIGVEVRHPKRFGGFPGVPRTTA